MSTSLKTVVIGTSLTGTSDGVVRTGAAVARKTGAFAWLVHVFPAPPISPELGPLDGEWIERQNRDLYEALVQQADRTGLSDVPGFRPGQLLPLIGSPPRELVEHARQVKAAPRRSRGPRRAERRGPPQAGSSSSTASPPSPSQ